MNHDQNSSEAELYVGIMSGTSLDGIDTALLDFSGITPKLLATHYLAYPDELKKSLLKLHQPAINELHLAQLMANELAHLYASATQTLIRSANTAPEQIRNILS